MPRFEDRVATIRSAHPASAALPAKQRPLTIATVGTRPDNRANNAKASASNQEPPRLSVSPGRPPPPSAKTTTGRPSRSASAKSRSFLVWLAWPWVPARTV